MRISQRMAAIQPTTYDAETRSAVALLATEDAIYSTDSATKKPILEVWRADGLEPVDQVPLCDAHEKSSVADVIGSVSDIKVKDRTVYGTIRISSAEADTAVKVEEGHIRDVSCGIAPLEVVVIQRGATREVNGESYTAPDDSDLRIVTRWRLREVSLCPIGADPSAKIRAATTENCSMNEKMRAYLRGIGLPDDASDEDARAFYDSLPERARQRADEEAAKEPDGDERAEGDDEKKDDEPAATEKASPEKLTTRAAGKARQSAESVRTAERSRISEIQRLGEGLPAEHIRRAIDEGWTKEQAAVSFLDLSRTQRSKPSLPAIHSRSHEADCTVETLGMGLAIRSVGDNKLFATPAQYAAAGLSERGEGDYVLRRSHDKAKHEREASEMLERSYRYSHMSLVDLCREACRLDGKQVSVRTAPSEVFRTAVSGSSMAAIFTTNFNAQFMTGYVDFDDTTTEWTHSEDVVNFLTREVATMGKFGQLEKVSRGQTAKDMNTSDWKESYKIARYGGKFTVDEQDIINDRFGALEQESPKDMGLAAAQLRPGLVYSEILNNANLDADGGALFNATAVTTAGGHANYASGGGSALSASTLQTGIAAIRKQRIANRVLNLNPKFLIVPQALYFSADTLVNSPQRIISADSGGTKNPLLGLLGVIGDDRIGTAGVVDPRTGSVVAGADTNWLLVCRPGDQGAKTVMVGYLAGTGRAPKIRSYVLDRGQWGLGWDVSFDIGVKALDFRAMYFSAGA